MDSPDSSAIGATREKQLMALNEKSDIPDTVYHYCGEGGFKSIFKSKQIWLSDVHHMNDSTEQTWLIDKARKRLQELNQGDIGQYIQSINVNIERMAFDPHAFCFSRNADMLSQWRAYADDGEGYSIGYSSSWLKNQKHLHGRHYVALWEVEYDEDRQMELLNHYIDQYLTRVREGGDRRNEGEKLILAIYSLSAACKNPHFREEQEIRLMIGEPRNKDIYTAKANQRGILNRFYRDNEISCFSLAFPEDAITSIYLGPRHSAKNDNSALKTFLTENGYISNQIRIINSDIPYRRVHDERN